MACVPTAPYAGAVDEAAARARRRAVLVTLVGTAIGAVLIASRHHLMPTPSAARAPLILGLFGGVAVVPLLALAAYLWRLGARAVDEGRLPPAGITTMRPGAVLVGVSARRQARLFQMFAALFGAAALILAALLWRLSRLLPPG